jgi:hypothetical protein
MKTYLPLFSLVICLCILSCENESKMEMLPDVSPVIQLNVHFEGTLDVNAFDKLSFSHFNENLINDVDSNRYVHLPKEIEFGPSISFIADSDFYKVICGARAKGNGASIVISIPETGFYKTQKIDGDQENWSQLISIENLNFIQGKKVKIYLKNDGLEDVRFDDLNLVVRKRPSLAIFNEIPKLAIDIDTSTLLQLEMFKEQALTQNYISEREKKYVPVNVNGQLVNIRIKGDYTDHIAGGKMSFRVKDPAGNYSIHHPKTRGYLKEWLWHKVLKDENILTTDYSFTEVFINNETKGLFAKEAHFDTVFGTHQNRKGLVLKFNEDALWSFQKVNKPKEFWQYYYVYDVAPITTFKFSKNTSGIRRKWFLNGAETVTNLRNGKIDSSKIDLEAFAKYFAMNDLFLTSHALSWNNIRFFYNSKSKKIEPIGYDGYADKSIPEKWKNTELMGLKDDNHDTIYHSSIYLWAQFFNFPGFTGMYVQNLERYSSSSFLDAMKLKFGAELSHLNLELEKEFSSYKFSFEAIEERQIQIRELLKQRNGFADKNNKFTFYSMFEWGNEHPSQTPRFNKTTCVEHLYFESYLLGDKTKYRNLHPSNIQLVNAIFKDGSILRLNKVLKGYDPLGENEFQFINKKVDYFELMINGELIRSTVKTKFYHNDLD